MGSDNKRRSRYLCRCICGTEKNIIGTSLKNNTTKSCGCLHKQQASILGKISIRNLHVRQTNIDRKRQTAKRAFKDHKRHAKTRNIDSRLTFDQYFNIIKQPCTYCNAMSKRKDIDLTNEMFPLNSCDRRNNEKYYDLSNAIPVCFDCQSAKNDKTEAEYLAHIEAITLHQNRKNAIILPTPRYM